MADLSANAYRKVWGEKHTDKFVVDNSAAQEIFIGAPLIIDISEDTSYPRIFDSGVTLATGDAFLGIADTYVDVETTDTEGDNEIMVIRQPTIVGFESSSFTRANIGDSMYMSDSNTLTTTAGSNLKIGTVHDIRDGWVYVKLEYWQSS